MEKRKIYGIVIGIIAFTLLLIGATYAYFYWGSTTAQQTNVNLNVSKGLENLIVYKQGTSILGSANRSFTPSASYTGGISATIEFWRKSNATKTIYGQISLELLQLVSASGTTNANIGKTDTIKWAITTYTATNATEVLVNQGTFNGKRQGDKFAITENFALSNVQTYYKIYLWLDQNAINPDLSIAGELISAEISASASDTQSHYGASPIQVLTKLGLSGQLKKTTPSFSAVSTASDTGIYATQDNFGATYYFRGNVTNNYVKFGKNSSGTDMYWRIIRINGDGSIRMIYDGTSAYANGTSNTARRATTSAFKSSPYNSNTYIGYMYGATGSTYAATHTNATNSTIKTAVDNWYNTNIVNTGYAGYVVDAIYCNDRSLVSGSGVGTTATTYGAYGRLVTNKTPSLVCSQAIDKFTKSTALGNGKLTYPVGLITADEVALAGGLNGTNNTAYYLYTGHYYYTMSSYNFASSTANIFGVNASGALSYSNNYTSYGVKPVISIRADAIASGSGTTSSPFIVS